MSKWKKTLLGGGIFGVLLMALSFFGCGSVHTSIVIPASPENIWSVLTDPAGYSEWNPVLVPFEGELRQGETVMYRMTDHNGKTSEVEATVIEMVERKTLNQFGGMRGILTFDHSWTLEEVEGGTRVTQHEEYRGIGVWFWDYSWVEVAYSRANEALQKRVLQFSQDR